MKKSNAVGFFFGQPTLFSFLKKKGRGQASIELILLLAVVLLLVATVIMPSFDVAEQAAADTSSIAIARSQAQKLANAIELVDSSPVGAKQTIHLMVPARTQIKCHLSAMPPGIRFIVRQELSAPEACNHDDIPGLPGTADDACNGFIPLNISSIISCTPLELMFRMDQSTAAFFTAEISKDSTGVTVVFNG